MTRDAQSLLVESATRLLRARRWLDERLIDRAHGLEEAARLVSDVRGMLEGVELQIGREAATREEMLSTPESIP